MTIFGLSLIEISKDVGLPVLGVVGAWALGVFKKLLPSPQFTVCAIGDFISGYLHSIRRSGNTPRFSILIASIDGDTPNNSAQTAIMRAFQGSAAFDRRRTCKVIKLGAGETEETSAAKRGRALLKRHGADILIWGEVQKSDEMLRLWFTTENAVSDFKESSFTLKSNGLGEDFAEATKLQLVATALSYVPGDSGQFLLDVLLPTIQRINTLIAEQRDFTNQQLADLHNAAGLASVVVAQHQAQSAPVGEAIAHYENAIALIDRSSNAHQWGVSHRRLAAAYSVKADMDLDSALYAKAEYALRQALQVFDKDHTSIEWARTARMLAQLQAEDAVANRDSKKLELAIADLRDILTDKLKFEALIFWIEGQNMLGFQLHRLGKLESSIARFNESEAIFEAAEAAISAKEAPTLLCGLYNNHATMLLTRDELSPDTVLLHRSIELLRRKLSIVSADKALGPWAGAQLNLASALIRVGERERDRDSLVEAIDCLEIAIDRLPEGAAAIIVAPMLASLGNAIIKLDDLDVAEGVIGIMSVHPEREAPLGPGQSKNWIALRDSIAPAAQLESRAAENIPKVEAAVTALKRARDMFARDHDDGDWATTVNMLGIAQLRLATRKRDPDLLTNAEDTIKTFISAKDCERQKAEWAMGVHNLGSASLTRGALLEEPVHFVTAESHFRKALRARIEVGNDLNIAESSLMVAAAIVLEADGKANAKLVEAKSLLDSSEPIFTKFHAASRLSHIAQLQNSIENLELMELSGEVGPA